jgi:CheY-like chemotaxis protein
MTSNESLQLPRKYCILCVDDDLIGLELRAALLEEEGYFVTAVSCPLMALEHDVSKFHMAILDFAMPVLNGFQLLLRLRTARASFPIVLLSGMSRNFTERHPQCVLKLPRQRRTDTSFAEHRAFLSDFDPRSTGVPWNGQRCSSPAS